jgi:hypothetical protein
VNGSVPPVFVVAIGATACVTGALTVCWAPLTDLGGWETLVIVCRAPLTPATTAGGNCGVSGTALGAGVAGVLGVAGVPTGTITLQ